MELYGTKNWKNIANMLGTRIGKQRRERWQNHLRHDIKVISFFYIDILMLLLKKIKSSHKSQLIYV